MLNFKLIAKNGLARAGVLQTSHGIVETPVFMPVGTQATVKALKPTDLKEAGVQIILGNTYHLYLRPGSKRIKKMGGLHKFMGWDGPILTDSGGFQAFSLGAMIEHGVRKVGAKVTGTGSKVRGPATAVSPRPSSLDSLAAGEASGSLFGVTPHQFVNSIIEQGIIFTSHLDGSEHLLTPEKSIEVQLDLGSDICLVLDELLSPVHDAEYVKTSLARTHRWEERSFKCFKAKVAKSSNKNAQIFGILQGVTDKTIRQMEAKWVGEQNFDGVSIGGSFASQGDWAASVAIYQTMSWVVPLLPETWPKHALGIGEVRDIFECVDRGIDMFDCVAPTRRARNGSLYLSQKSGGNIKNHFQTSIYLSCYKDDPKPIDPKCDCYTCQNFSKSYLRHLFLAKEILYHELASIHNVHFILRLTKQMRNAILDGNFVKLKDQWLG